MFRGNVVWNLTGTVLPAFVQFFCIPWYVEYLGVATYGLVGMANVVGATLLVFDFGVLTAVNRALGRAKSHNAADTELRAAFRAFRSAGLLFVLAGSLVLWVILGFLSAGWAGETGISPAGLRMVVVEIAVLVVLRWLVGFHLSAAQGLGKHIAVNTIQIAFTTVGSLGALAVLVLWRPDPRAFFGWMIGTAFLDVLALSVVIRRSMPAARPARADRALLSEYRRFGALMVPISVTGILLSQSDKWIGAKMAGIGDFGSYAVVLSASAALAVIIQPLFVAFYSRFNRLQRPEDRPLLHTEYEAALQCLAFLLIPLALFVTFFSADLLLLWTSDPDLTADIAGIVPLYFCATAINGIMHVPYAMQLSSNRLGLSLGTNLVLCAFLYPLTWVLIRAFGISGAAAAWLAINACYLPMGIGLTAWKIIGPERSVRHFGLVLKWFALGTAFWLPARWLLVRGDLSSAARAISGLALLAACYGLMLAFDRSVRATVLQLARDL